VFLAGVIRKEDINDPPEEEPGFAATDASRHDIKEISRGT
jgi:hypothetical protein